MELATMYEQLNDEGKEYIFNLALALLEAQATDNQPINTTPVKSK